jgi:hypothetical protein
MAWYRIAIADYPEHLRNAEFASEPDNRTPRIVALETGQVFHDLNETNAVNVVYYFDVERDIECGDFFFEGVTEALAWCSEALKINDTAFRFLNPPTMLSE